MLPTVYVETTIPSYLAALPSRDPVYAANQQMTEEWWNTATQRFELFISEYVLDEIQQGDPEAAQRRLDAVSGLPILELNKDVEQLVAEYTVRLGFRGRALADVPHFAFAVAYEMDYLLTWNCRHIANGEVIRRLRDANRELGRSTPLILTPLELQPLEENNES